MATKTMSAQLATTTKPVLFQDQPTPTGRHTAAQLGSLCKKLVVSDADVDAAFAKTVAIDGNYIVVGASGDDDAGSMAGAAYLYRTTDGGATWDFVQKIVASDADESDSFGYAVAIHGNHIVVGAYTDDDAALYSGSAYIYRTTDFGESWVQILKLVAADAALNDKFGCSVAIEADVIAIGTDAAGVYIFSQSSGRWYQSQKIVPPHLSTSNCPGVAISGNRMLIGAFWDDDASIESGSVYPYKTVNRGETWEFGLKFVASNAAAYDHFGRAVAIDGKLIVVGADGYDGAGITNSGSVYTFQLLTCASMKMFDSFGDGA